MNGVALDRLPVVEFREPNVDFRDSDGDGIINHDDNCPFASNPNQGDSDGDGAGDPLDLTPGTPKAPAGLGHVLGGLMAKGAAPHLREEMEENLNRRGKSNSL